MLKTTVANLGEVLSDEEMFEWQVYFEIKNEQLEERRKSPPKEAPKKQRAFGQR